MLILEVDLVEGLEWEIDIEVAIEGNGKAGITEVSGHVTEFFWEGGVCAEAMCIQGNIH